MTDADCLRHLKPVETLVADLAVLWRSTLADAPRASARVRALDVPGCADGHPRRVRLATAFLSGLPQVVQGVAQPRTVLVVQRPVAAGPTCLKSKHFSL